jgi:antitoxin CptB
MLELDYLLRGFLDNEYAGLTDERKRDFIRLLEQPDPLLYDWFTGNSVPAEPATRRLVSEILESAAGRGREGPA